MNIAGTLSPVTITSPPTWTRTGTRIISLPLTVDNGRASLIATPLGATWITCTSPTACSSMAPTVGYSLGNVIGMAVDHKRAVVWIASDTGLFKVNAAVGSTITQEKRVDHGCTAIEFNAKYCHFIILPYHHIIRFLFTNLVCSYE
jgi:hypothetical protein